MRNDIRVPSIARLINRAVYALVISASCCLFVGDHCLHAAPSCPVVISGNTDVEQLIEMLASPNEMPTWPGGDTSDGPPDYPGDYDKAAQTRVLSARDALVAKGTTAFELLIKHTDDYRYSYTEQRGKAFWVNVHVAHVCREIIAVQVEVFRPFIRPSGPTDPRRFWVPGGRVALEQWWDSHKHQGLCAIQIEAVKWAREKTRESALLNEDERIAALKDLLKLLERLDAGGAIKVDYKGKHASTLPP